MQLELGIEFNGSARATWYSIAGYVTTWKAGGIWQPIEDIRPRVAPSCAIRVLNLNELFAAASANSDSLRNPAFTNDGASGPATFGYSANTTGNLNLRPERSDSWNASVVRQFCDGYAPDPSRSSPSHPYYLYRRQPFNAARQLVRGVDGCHRLLLDAICANGAVLCRSQSNCQGPDGAHRRAVLSVA